MWASAPSSVISTTRVLRIDDGEGNARIATHITILLPAFGGVEEDVAAVVVHPDGRYLGAAVGHQSAEISKRTLAEKITIFIRNGLGHSTSCRKISHSIIAVGRAGRVQTMI
jgi:hypothetical protein